jgi:hypothetical protein
MILRRDRYYFSENIPTRAKTFFSCTISRAASGLTQAPIQWVQGVVLLGVRRQGREDDH